MKKTIAVLFVVLLAALSTVVNYPVLYAWANTQWSVFTYAITNGLTLRSDLARWSDDGYDVKEFGAICNGTSHPLSERYGSLSAAQSDYPFVDDLTQTIDWAAIQRTIDVVFSLNRRVVKISDSASCAISLPIYLDSPGNLRGGGTNYNSAFSYSLLGTSVSGGITYISIQNSNLNHTPVSSPTWWRPLKWASGTTYANGDIAVYNGIPWISQAGSNTNHAPTITTLTWWKPATNTLTPFVNSWYALVGAEGQPSLGTPTLLASFGNTAGLIIGPGNGNLVRNIAVSAIDATAPDWRCARPPDGVGILISGGSFGASRTLLENIYTYDWFTGVATGGEQLALADSNTIRKSHIEWSCIGVKIAQQQNFINFLEDVNINYSTISVFAPNGTPVTIVGGNYSAVQAKANFFTWSSPSVLTATNDGNGNFVLSFTATVSTPDSYLDIGVLPALAFNTASKIGGEPTGVYNAFDIATSHFGIVPAVLTAYNTSTKLATFQIMKTWSYYFFPKLNAKTTSDLEAEIQAASGFYAAELTTVLWGNGFDVSGIHLETTAPNRLIAAESGARNTNVLRSINGENVDPALPFWRPSASPSASNLAQYYTMQSFCWICIVSGGVTLENSYLGLITDPVLVDWKNGGAVPNRFVAKENIDFKINVRVNNETGTFVNNTSYSSINTANLGGGEYDKTPMPSTGNKEQGDQWRLAWGQAPQWGWRPAAYAKPCITPAQQTILAGTIPAITHTGSGETTAYTIGYPLLWGGQVYSLCDWYLGTPTHWNTAVSNHFYSYYQNLTTTNVPNLSWNYKPGGSWVCHNVELIPLAFPGWGIKLNDGTSDVLYIVTGVYPGLSCFTVAGAASATDNSRLSGPSTSTAVTGTTIVQEALSIQYPFLLKRDLDPASNDNSPAFMDMVA